VSTADGSWYANPVGHVGHELIAAGMLILAAGGAGKPVDYDELEPDPGRVQTWIGRPSRRAMSL